jgi:predicted nucleotidyltransferase
MSVDLAPALEILHREIQDLAGVYLFGSHATGTERAGSDVDLAVFAGRALPGHKVLNLTERVSEALCRDVDLVDLAAASTILQMQVMRDGRLIAAPDAKSVGLFELRVLRDYRDLKARRAGIEADIVRRGRVHA